MQISLTKVAARYAARLVEPAPLWPDLHCLKGPALVYVVGALATGALAIIGMAIAAYLG